MMWTVRHHWTAVARFAFNCYKHWVQLLLSHLGSPSVTLMIRNGVMQGYPLSMVLYGITLVPLTKDL